MPPRRKRELNDIKLKQAEKARNKLQETVVREREIKLKRTEKARKARNKLQKTTVDLSGRLQRQLNIQRKLARQSKSKSRTTAVPSRPATRGDGDRQSCIVYVEAGHMDMCDCRTDADCMPQTAAEQSIYLWDHNYFQTPNQNISYCDFGPWISGDNAGVTGCCCSSVDSMNHDYAEFIMSMDAYSGDDNINFTFPPPCGKCTSCTECGNSLDDTCWARCNGLSLVYADTCGDWVVDAFHELIEASESLYDSVEYMQTLSDDPEATALCFSECIEDQTGTLPGASLSWSVDTDCVDTCINDQINDPNSIFNTSPFDLSILGGTSTSDAAEQLCTYTHCLANNYTLTGAPHPAAYYVDYCQTQCIAGAEEGIEWPPNTDAVVEALGDVGCVDDHSCKMALTNYLKCKLIPYLNFNGMLKQHAMSEPHPHYSDEDAWHPLNTGGGEDARKAYIVHHEEVAGGSRVIGITDIEYSSNDPETNPTGLELFLEFHNNYEISIQLFIHRLRVNFTVEINHELDLVPDEVEWYMGEGSLFGLVTGWGVSEPWPNGAIFDNAWIGAPDGSYFVANLKLVPQLDDNGKIVQYDMKFETSGPTLFDMFSGDFGDQTIFPSSMADAEYIETGFRPAFTFQLVGEDHWAYGWVGAIQTMLGLFAHQELKEMIHEKVMKIIADGMTTNLLDDEQLEMVTTMFWYMDFTSEECQNCLRSCSEEFQDCTGDTGCTGPDLQNCIDDGNTDCENAHCPAPPDPLSCDLGLLDQCFTDTANDCTGGCFEDCTNQLMNCKDVGCVSSSGCPEPNDRGNRTATFCNNSIDCPERTCESTTNYQAWNDNNMNFEEFEVGFVSHTDSFDQISGNSMQVSDSSTTYYVCNRTTNECVRKSESCTSGGCCGNRCCRYQYEEDYALGDGNLIPISGPDCLLGDMNGDTGFNVLDIVTLANCVLAGTCTDTAQWECAGDLNGDGGYNVLDIVTLANCVLAGACGADANGDPTLDTYSAYQPPPGMTQVEQDSILKDIINGTQDIQSIKNILDTKVPQHIINSGRTQAKSKGKFKK